MPVCSVHRRQLRPTAALADEGRRLTSLSWCPDHEGRAVEGPAQLPAPGRGSTLCQDFGWLAACAGLCLQAQSARPLTLQDAQPGLRFATLSAPLRPT